MKKLSPTDFINISIQDRGIIVGLIVVALAVAVIIYDANIRDNSTRQDAVTADRRQDGATGGNSRYRNADDKGQHYATEAKKVTLVTFDPNTADSTTLLKLGLQPWQVRSIYRYRAAGGAYTCPEDFARLYGLTVKKYKELLPYIKISPEYRAAGDIYGRRRHTDNRLAAEDRRLAALNTDTAQGNSMQDAYPKKLKQGQTMDISLADTITLRRIPGIGPFFARKIVRHREQLGGFASAEQLLEIDGFPESALQYITVGKNSLRQININSATPEKLRAHPYISYTMAKQISDYRRIHGRINDISELRLLKTFPQHVIDKLRPYITY